MEEGQDIVSYFEKVDTTLNEIRELRGTLSDEDVIDKILMTLPVRYNYKISEIEETYNPKKFTKEQLFGTLTAFEGNSERTKTSQKQHSRHLKTTWMMRKSWMRQKKTL